MDSRTYYERNTVTTPPLEQQDPNLGKLTARRASVIVDRLARTKSASVLDVGCGDGYLLSRIASTGAVLSGADIAETRLEQARTRFSEDALAPTWFRAPAESIPCENGAFDCVVSSEVLEHLPDPGLAAREAFRIIKPAGTYVVTVPYRENIVQHLCVHCGELTPQYGHLHRFDGDSLRGLLEDAGFVDVEWEPFVSLNNKRAIARSLLRPLPDRLWLIIDRWLCRTFDEGVWVIAIASRP